LVAGATRPPDVGPTKTASMSRHVLKLEHRTVALSASWRDETAPTANTTPQ
jgi:hypothetical protein